MPRTVDLIEQGIAAGWHLGAQVYASIGGEAVVDVAIGEAQAGWPMTTDTLMVWKSATKPVTAAAVLQCVERGELDLHAPVCRYLPAFAQHGKQDVTVHHVLTHSGGFRHAAFSFPEEPWAHIIEAICASPLEEDWVPGERVGYHPLTGWFILGELVQRVTGDYFPSYVREHIFGPLGMEDCWIGMPPEVYEAYERGHRLGALVNTSGDPRNSGDPRPELSHTQQWLVACSPGSNGCGPVRQLARFYEMLLNGGELRGRRVLRRETVHLKTRRHKAGAYDDTFSYRMNWGLGLLLDMEQRRGRMPYGYGRHASPDTFGHSGVRSSAAFADPRHHLAAAVAFSGMPGEREHQQRIDSVLTALYEDLGLARGSSPRG